MPARRVSLNAFESFLRQKRLPVADTVARSAEGGLPLDRVKVIEAVPMTAGNLAAPVFPDEAWTDDDTGPVGF